MKSGRKRSCPHLHQRLILRGHFGPRIRGDGELIAALQFREIANLIGVTGGDADDGGTHFVKFIAGFGEVVGLNGAASGKCRREEIEHHRPLLQSLLQGEGDRFTKAGAFAPTGSAAPALNAVADRPSATVRVKERARFFISFIISSSDVRAFWSGDSAIQFAGVRKKVSPGEKYLAAGCDGRRQFSAKHRRRSLVIAPNGDVGYDSKSCNWRALSCNCAPGLRPISTN